MGKHTKENREKKKQREKLQFLRIFMNILEANYHYT